MQHGRLEAEEVTEGSDRLHRVREKSELFGPSKSTTMVPGYSTAFEWTILEVSPRSAVLSRWLEMAC